jgi:uncharacterized protein YbaR (Trm112 family)
MERMAWSLRRLHCPVSKEALVLDVGSGGNPYPRANVLLDAYEETVERFYVPLVKDRPMVLGIVENLPFKDKCFDFVIASHILEHTSEPDKFLKELMRVGKSGYIETPDAFFERINPYLVHRLEVSEVESGLKIVKKAFWKFDPEIVDLYEKKAKVQFVKFFSKHPEFFFTRFYWSDKINYEIVNPNVKANWPIPFTSSSDICLSRPGIKVILRAVIVKILRNFFSQTSRNKQLNLLDVLSCPLCSSSNLFQEDNTIRCRHCGVDYPVVDGVPHMFPHGDSGGK